MKPSKRPYWQLLEKQYTPDKWPWFSFDFIPCFLCETFFPACRILRHVDFQILRELLGDTGAKSFQMDVRGPWIAAGDFANRFGVDLALKDVRLGCEMADAWSNNAKTMKVALEYYKEASAEGFGKEDCNAIYKVIK